MWKTAPGRTSLNVDRLGGADKVATLLLTMGKPLAGKFIKHFTNEEVRLVAKSAANLPTVPLSVIEKIIDELVQRLEAEEALKGSQPSAEQLISGAVSDEQVSEIMSELQGTSADRVWLKLDDAQEERLARFIAQERPQVAAFIVSKLNAEKAALVMNKLDESLRADLCKRLLTLKPISDAAARLVADRLGQEFFRTLEEHHKIDNHKRLADILNNLDRKNINDILERIAHDSADDIPKVRAHIFSFEDIAGMGAEDRSRLLDAVGMERTVLALRACDRELQAIVLKSVSPRSQRLIEAELGTPTNAQPSTIVQAQRAIAELARSMAANGELTLRPPAEAGS